jgi:hypothetical protein
MTDENQEQQEEQQEQGNGEDTIESLAEDMGWSHKENWQGKDEDWVDAKTFILNADAIQKQQSGDMKKLKGQLSSLTSKIEQMSVNQSRSIKTAIDSAKERWEKERLDAIEESDTEKFKRADGKIKELDQQADNGGDLPDPNKLANAIQGEALKRDWYKDEFLKTEAVIIGNSLASLGNNGGAWEDAVEFVDAVESHLKFKYPDKMVKPMNKPAPLSKPRPNKTTTSLWDKLKDEMPQVENAFQELLTIPGTMYKDNKEGRELYAKHVYKEKEE